MPMIMTATVAALSLLLAGAPAIATAAELPGATSVLQQQKEKPGKVRAPQQANERGKAQKPAKAQKPDKAQKPAKAQKPGRAARADGRLTREQVRGHVLELPQDVQRLGRSARLADRIVVDAAARGVARGLQPRGLSMAVVGDRVRVLNDRGELLIDMPESSARSLGAWDMRRMGDQRPKGNGPAFCRSGEGHPVWGREWCIEKGFGLGSRDDRIWSRTTVEDIIFGRGDDRRTDRRDDQRRDDRLDRGGLIDVLGDVVFGRLAVHALTLGLDSPLTGVWLAEADGRQLLLVRAGDEEVAEFADLNGDGRADVLYVIQPR